MCRQLSILLTPERNAMPAPAAKIFTQFLRRLLISTAVLGLVVTLGGPLRAAERPSAMKLFPEETLLFIRTSNAYEFGQRMRDSSTGRMLRDPQLQPFVEQLYGDAGKLYAEKAEQFMGISFKELQKLPQGEVAFGIVARSDKLPAFLLLVDQGEESSVAERLLERALTFAREAGGEFSNEKIDGVEVTVVRDADDENRVFGVFERDNTIVVATDPNVLRSVLHHWGGGGDPTDASAGVRDEAGDGDAAREDASSSDSEAEREEAEFIPGRTLAENGRFATIVRHCRRPQDPPPHLIFFANPIELVRNFGREKGGVQFAMAMLPSLGIDGLMGVGGSFTAATDEYDDLSHFHVLLENPRSGVMQLPAFEQGDTAPQAFVPLTTESYLAWHWNMRVAYDRVAALVDQFQAEGSTDKIIEEKVSQPLGIDFPTEVLDNLGMRYTWIVGYEKPAKFRGQQHVLAIELKDEAAAGNTLQTVVDKYPDLFEERRFGQVAYHAILPKGLKDLDEEQRPMEPCVAVMDGYLFLGTSCQLFERSVGARDGTVDRLVESEDYARTTEVLGRETAGTAPVLFAVSRYEESIRHWYELLTSEKTREMIGEHKEDNPVLTALAEALDQHKLPPFEVLAPYLPPGGMILYDTDDGYHGIGFTLRNEPR
jgi:hypothetical protein